MLLLIMLLFSLMETFSFVIFKIYLNWLLSSAGALGMLDKNSIMCLIVPQSHSLMHMEFFYTRKTTIFTFLCILALSTAYSRTGYASAQGYTSTTLALSDVILPRDGSLFLQA